MKIVEDLYLYLENKGFYRWGFVCISSNVLNMRGNFGVTVHQANCRRNLEQIGRIRRLPRANTTFSEKNFYLFRPQII